MTNLKSLAQANFGGGFEPPTDAYSVVGGNDSATGRGALPNFEFAFSNLIGLLTVVASVYFVFQFVMGAFNWVSAGGEQSKVQKAREKMTQSTIGLIVIVMTYGLVGLIGSVVGLDLLRPANVFDTLIPFIP